jgi:putative adhesin
MRKTLMVICMLLVAAGAYADKKVHKTAQLSPNGSVSIDTHNGTVVVTTWNQPTVDVSARIEAGDWGSEDDVNATQINVTGSGNDVSIESDYTAVGTHLNWWGISRNLPLVHYAISVPATARLNVTDHNSSVRVTGLRNDLRVSSHNGAVEIVDLDGAANIETHNGDIRAAYSHFSRNSSFETHNGAIEIKLPSEAKLRVNANGHHMDVDSDFPTVITRRPHEGSFAGDINGGGPELKVSTHNGALRLRKG